MAALPEWAVWIINIMVDYFEKAEGDPFCLFHAIDMMRGTHTHFFIFLLFTFSGPPAFFVTSLYEKSIVPRLPAHVDADQGLSTG